MRMIAIAFAAAITLGFAAPAMAAQDAKGPALPVQTHSLQTDAVKASDEVSAGRRNWKRHGWHGKRNWHRHKWRGHRWHGYRGWKRGWGWRHRGWRHCWRVWVHGRRIVVCR